MFVLENSAVRLWGGKGEYCRVGEWTLKARAGGNSLAEFRWRACNSARLQLDEVQMESLQLGLSIGAMKESLTFAFLDQPPV